MSHPTCYKGKVIFGSLELCFFPPDIEDFPYSPTDGIQTYAGTSYGVGCCRQQIEEEPAASERRNVTQHGIAR
jgi:hypothetical protein